MKPVVRIPLKRPLVVLRTFIAPASELEHPHIKNAGLLYTITDGLRL